MCEAAPQNALRHHLQRDVQQRDAGHGESDRARYGPLGVAQFTTWHQRALDARKREDQQQAGASDVAGRRHRRDAQVFAVDEERTTDGHQKERQQLGDRRDRIEPHAKRDAAQIDEHPEAVGHDKNRDVHCTPGEGWNKERPRLDAKTVDTAAVANVPSIHNSTPERKAA